MPRPIDATALVKLVLEERDKIPLEVVERHSFGVPSPNKHGQSMRGGIRKVLRLIEQAPTLDYAPVKRGEWVKTRKHMWKQDEEGNVDTWAWERGYHNGPCCIICSASPCEHCNPDYEKLKNCHEHYICSECGRMVISPEPYCHCGARMNAKEEAHV